MTSVQPESTVYVEPPTIPAGMTCHEYRRRRRAARARSLRRRLTGRFRRALGA